MVRVAAYGSAVLLAIWNRDGIPSACLALDYSVFSACAGALVVAVYEEKKKSGTELDLVEASHFDSQEIRCENYNADVGALSLFAIRSLSEEKTTTRRCSRCAEVFD